VLPESFINVLSHVSLLCELQVQLKTHRHTEGNTGILEYWNDGIMFLHRI
jgi:hypothetical protein